MPSALDRRTRQMPTRSNARRPVAAAGRKPEATLADVFLGRIDLADAVENTPRTSWIQLFKTGKFWDDRYGNFSITRADLAQMLENFRTVTPEAPTKLPIDYNHGTSRPVSAEAGKAAGWITDLALRADGDQLWANVEWTDGAAAMIAAKEYQFVSPTFAYEHTHSNGEDIGTTLLAAAICNRPVLEGMEPLSLSAPSALQLDETSGVKALRVLNRDGSVIEASDDEAAEALFSFDEQRRRVQAALTEAFGVAYGFGDAYCGPCSGCYLVDVFDGRAVYREYSGATFEVHFTIDAAGTVHFTDTPAEVVIDYRTLGETQMAKTITVKDAKGNDVQLTEEVALALAKEHAPAPARPAAEVVDLAKFQELSQKVEAQAATVLDLTAKNAALELEAKTRQAREKVDGAIRLGKIAPVEREEQIEFALANPALFDKTLAKRPTIIGYDKRTGSEAENVAGSASDEVIALSKVEQDKNTKLTTQDAMAAVFKKNPELYERYKAEAAVKV